MNIQQLEYIVAVDEHRHFQKAADACFVTPATLSMMVKKLEQELNMILFDRSRQPVTPTETGSAIIEKARVVLHHIGELQDLAKYASEEIAGEVRLAIIPTLAPYLSHLFLPNFLKQHPKVNIKLFEWNTNQIIEALKHNRVDIGIAATPLHVPEITETQLFYEKLMAYTAKGFDATDKTFIAPEDIDLRRLWLLSEEHCLRSQVVNLCSLKKMEDYETPLDFEAGSIETLLNIVGINEGITIIPELVVPTLSPKRKANVRPFQAPVPVREISLLTYRHFVKDKLLQAFRSEILKAIVPIIKATDVEKKVVAI